MSLSDLGLMPKIAATMTPSMYSTQSNTLTIHPLAQALFTPKFKWEIPPLSLTVAKHKQFNLPSRSQILEWQRLSLNIQQKGHSYRENSESFLPVGCSEFSNLSSEELLSATLIDNTDFIEKFLKNYPTETGILIHLPSQRTIPSPYPNDLHLPFNLISKLRVIFTSDPLIYLDRSQMKQDELLEWLNRVSNGHIFDLPLRSLNKEDPQQNLLWFNNQSFHSLEQWLANELQKSILRYYFNPKDRFNRVKQLREHIIEKKISKHFLQVLEVTLDDIKEGFLDEKSKLIQQFRFYDESLRQQQRENILNMVDDKRKKKKKRNKKQKAEKIVTKNEEIEDNPINMFDVQINISQTQTEQKPVQYLVKFENASSCLSNDNQTKTKQEIPQFSQLQINEDFNSSTKAIELDFCSCSNIQIQYSKSFNNTNCSGIISSTSINENCLCMPFQSEQNIISDNNHNDSFQSLRLQRNSSHSNIGTSPLTQMEPEKQDNHDSDSITVKSGQFSQLKSKRRRRKRNQKTQNKVVDEFKEKVVSNIINRQLTNMIDGLSNESNSYFESKAIAFERVRYFVKSMYPMGEAILFGSNAVGLSLPSSDIDVMLIQLPCRSKEDIIDCLAKIGIYINTMGWIISCSTYSNAKVPLLKLQIDPTVGYFVPKRKSDYFQINDPYLAYYLDMKQPSKGVTVKVDITISTEEGTVSSSTQLMRVWLQEKPLLQRVLLALKYSLFVRGYSQNFKGGIGSYCLFVMVAAYFMQVGDEHKQDKECQIMLSILKFYGQQFQNQLKVVTLGYEGSKCFLQNEQARELFELTDQILFTNPLKIIDPLNGKLMSSSCFQYNNIKTEWRRIRSQILAIQELVENEIQTCFSNPNDITKLLSNKKGFERWVNKFQARVDYSVAKIIKGGF